MKSVHYKYSNSIEVIPEFRYHRIPIDYHILYGENYQPSKEQNKQIRKAVKINQIGQLHVNLVVVIQLVVTNLGYYRGVRLGMDTPHLKSLIWDQWCRILHRNVWCKVKWLQH